MAQQTIVIEVPGTPISELESTSSVASKDVLPIVQDGETKKVPLEQVTDLVKAGLGSAALKDESDFATPIALAAIASASQMRDDALHERVDDIEYTSAVTNSGRYTFKTYDIAVSKLSTIPVNSTVVVSNDPVDSKNMEYTYDGTSLEPQKLNLLGQTKVYVDQSIDNFAPNVLRTEKAVWGDYQNYADNKLNGYIDKNTGNFVANSGWHATDFIRVIDTTLVFRTGTSIAASSPAVAMALYDKNRAFIGVYNTTKAFFEVTPALININVAFVRLSYAGNATIFAHELNLFFEDFFSRDDILKGYISLTGQFVALDTWKTTPLIPCKLGQKFNYLGQGNSGSVSSISSFDKDGNFIETLFASTPLASNTLTISNPNAKYVRASGVAASNPVFTGIYLPQSQAQLRKYSTIVPDAVYALKNEAIYLYADGIVGNADNVAWNISGSNARVCKILPTSSESIPVVLQTIEDSNAKKTLASFNVLVTDTPKNPASKRYILTIGDSTTRGVANAGIEGAWPNECSRRLNGIGHQLLSNELSPAPLAISNIQFIGTLGDQIVKHEGRGGWRASHYLNNASVNNVTNAFWNPETSQFDLNYYLSQNGFTEVDATGSNLTVIIQLGWNDVYNSNAKQSAIDLGNLIDCIKATHANTDIICLGLNQAPDFMFKTYTGSRFVSKREVFESVKQFNDEYKSIIATKVNVDFLQISCTFCSAIGYDVTTTDPQTDPSKIDLSWHRQSARSELQLPGVDDHVHPNEAGYAMEADTVFYKLLYKYCR
ncbi:TPA: SGNH/GDSL hydrolase family protein [Acinetobacter baumannii]|nr:SGNH/GDSL hydrolase family protein [Acinetobacter baumannii]